MMCRNTRPDPTPGGPRRVLPGLGLLALFGLLALLGLLSVPALAEAGVPAQPSPPRRCDIPVELMAVVYNHRKPSRSFAMVVKGRDPARMVGVGSRVSGLRVLSVEPQLLWLQADPDALCWLPLAHDGAQSTSKARKKRKRRSKRKRRR
jgi:hypothetical protein